MNRPFTLRHSSGAEQRGASDTRPGVAPGPGGAHDIDRNATRWVFAATVGFWLAVFAVGHSFF